MLTRILLAFLALMVAGGGLVRPMCSEASPAELSQLRARGAVAWLESRGLYAPLRASLEREAYAIGARPAPAGAPEAANPAQSLRARFAADGVEVRPSADEGWRWGMQLSAYGRPGRLEPMTAATVVTSGNRVEYRYGAGFTEWYVNTAAGIEQGFTLAQAPGRRGAGPIELLLSVSGGLSPRLSAAGDVVHFVSADGRAVLGYRDLHSWDARGRALPSRMAVDAGRIRLIVDDRDAVYPVTVDPIVYSASTLTPTGGKADDEFGWWVAVKGNTAVVGAPSRWVGGLFKGAAFVFVLSGSSWVQQAELVAADGDSLDSFGAAVAIGGDTIVVGAPGGDVPGRPDLGVAYVFVRSGSTWSQQAKLVASDGVSGDGFGQAVALSADTAVIGAPNHDPGDKPLGGAAYVFTRSGTSWSQTAKLVGGPAFQGGAAFGFAVAASGSGTGDKTIVVGAPFFYRTAVGSAVGRATVFVGGGANWLKEENLNPSDGASGDAFGFSIGMSGDTVVIGAPGHDPGDKPLAGQAYVFLRLGATWTEEAKLLAGDGVPGDLFGAAVDIDGNLVAAGAPGRDTPAGTGAGQAYVFTRDSGIWNQQAVLRATAPGAQQFFGFALAVSGSTVVVGAPFHDALAGPDAGPVYAFTPSSLFAKVWVGLKNSDAVGLRVDLQTEVSVGNTVVMRGQTDNVGTGSSGFNNARLQTISLAQLAPLTYPATVKVTVKVRVSCSGIGHSNGIPRLWYNGQPIDSGASRDAGSRVQLPFSGSTLPAYLRVGSFLTFSSGVTRLSVDRFVNNAEPCPGRAFQPFATWTGTLAGPPQ